MVRRRAHHRRSRVRLGWRRRLEHVRELKPRPPAVDGLDSQDEQSATARSPRRAHVRSTSGDAGATEMRRLARAAAADLGLTWPSSADVTETIGDLPVGLRDGVLAAQVDGIVRIDGARFSVDVERGSSRWYPLFRRSFDGRPWLCRRRALQLVEYARLVRSARPFGWKVSLAAGPLDITATHGDDVRWGARVVEHEAPIERLLREVQRCGLAIGDDVSATDAPLRTAHLLHAGRFTHFSVLGVGVRHDHSVRHGDHCFVLRRDIAPC